jgi:hypothetical protein
LFLQVQREGLLALAHLARANHGVKPALVNAGACELTLSAMRAFPSDLRMQALGCKAVACLAQGHRGIQNRFGVMRVADLIPAAMKAFPT